MKHLTSWFVVVLLFALVGCGGSSVDLPESVMNDEAYAVVWIDFQDIEPEAGINLLRDLADDMPDEQPKARLWLSAEADEVEGAYQQDWEAFTDAGGQGLLTVYYRVETKATVTEGNATPMPPLVSYRTHTFIKAEGGAAVDELKGAIASIAKYDSATKIKLVAVGEDSGWYWLTREDASESAPKLPTGGSEATAELFADLMDEAEGAPIVAAWRMIEPIEKELAEELKREGMPEERKEELVRAKATRSVVMACTPGDASSTSVVIEFNDSDLADAYAEAHNDNLLTLRSSMKKNMINSESPPHPSVIDGVIDRWQAEVSGKSVTISLDSGAIQDLLNLTASRLGSGDSTTPAALCKIDRQLHVPSESDVPGVRSCYDALKFDRSRLP